MNDIVQNSKFGIGIGKGDGNTVVGNFFSKNGNNGYDLGNNNRWDDGGFGNYWSDYTGKDTNTDGIGDTPYVIPKNGIDNRPMINPRK